MSPMQIEHEPTTVTWEQLVKLDDMYESLAPHELERAERLWEQRQALRHASFGL